MRVGLSSNQQTWLLAITLAALVPATTARSPTRYDHDLAGVNPRVGYYGNEVSYSAPFAVGLDPLCILAGLAFLAFLVQTLYLALHKPIGMGALLSGGPLAERRNAVAADDTIRAVLSRRYEDLEVGNADPEERTISMDSSWQKSPLVALMSLTRSAWQNPECDGGLMCRLWYLARLLVGPPFWSGNVPPQ